MQNQEDCVPVFFLVDTTSLNRLSLMIVEEEAYQRPVALTCSWKEWK